MTTHTTRSHDEGTHQAAADTAARPSPAPPADAPEVVRDQRGRAADEPSEIPAAGWKDIAIRVKKDVADDHTALSAAGVAFYAFLAAIPGLAALVSIYALFVSPEQASDRIDDLFGTLPDDARRLLADQLEAIAGEAASTLSFSIIVSIGLSLWAASGGMSHLVEAVNLAYDEEESRGVVKRRLLAIALTIAAVAFVALAVAFITVAPSMLRSLGWPTGVRWMLSLLVWPLLGVGLAIGLAVLYRVAPDRRDAEWRWVSWGAVIAVILWIVASIGFQIYASNFGSYNETYGSLGAVVILLMWIWITSFIVLLGAQINAEMEHQTARDTTVGGDKPIGWRDAYVADHVGRAHP